MDCVFCDIIKRKAEAEILYENEKVISFLDIRPINFGHTLVVPKKHYENFLSLPQVELHALFDALQFISVAVRESIKADGFNIVINNGKAAGQTVFHFHFHIIPRFNNDFKFKPDFKSYSAGLMKEFADKIRLGCLNLSDPSKVKTSFEKK
jgi:histidine triad (HIT) family protein